MQPMTDAIVIAVVPGIVEVAKRVGMPVRFAGLAAIVAATLLIALGDLAAAAGPASAIAGWVVRGTMTGLAAAGLYSQATRIGWTGQRTW